MEIEFGHALVPALLRVGRLVIVNCDDVIEPLIGGGVHIGHSADRDQWLEHLAQRIDVAIVTVLANR